MTRDRWLSIEEVCRLTSYHRSTIYRLIRRAGFPRPRRAKDVPGRSVWSEAAVAGWMDTQLQEGHG